MVIFAEPARGPERGSFYGSRAGPSSRKARAAARAESVAFSPAGPGKPPESAGLRRRERYHRL